MFVAYMFCRATSEGDPAEYVTAYEPDEANELDYEGLDTGVACLWLVPRTDFQPIIEE